jgi:hypothetical protein
MKVVKITEDNTTTKLLNHNRMTEEAKMALLLFTVGIVLIGIGLIKKHGEDN